MTEPPNSSVPFTVVVSTVYGQMLVNRHDINQTNALFKAGRAFDHAEIVLLTNVLQLLGTGLTVVDVGANFGAHTLAMARCVGPSGKVHAFEAQRIIFNMLAGSVALNSLTNVFCYNMAVGEREGSLEMPQFDYSKPLNFGSVEFGPEQCEQLDQQRGDDPRLIEFVPLTTIDRFEFEDVALMKIDVEGMEMEVLRGAADTLRRCRPVIYLEFLKSDKDELRRSVEAMQYACYESGINFLCVPDELKERIRIEQAGSGPGEGPDRAP
jgi:FkbM family methyltransferase